MNQDVITEIESTEFSADQIKACKVLMNKFQYTTTMIHAMCVAMQEEWDCDETNPIVAALLNVAKQTPAIESEMV